MGVYQRIADMDKWKRITLIVVCIFSVLLIGAVVHFKGAKYDLSAEQKASILAIAQSEMGTEGTWTVLDKAFKLRTREGDHTIANAYYKGSDGDTLLTIDLDASKVVQRIDRRGWMVESQVGTYRSSWKGGKVPPIPALLFTKRHSHPLGPIIPLVILVILAYGIDWLFFSRRAPEEKDRDEESDSVIISKEKEGLPEDEEPEEEPVKKKKKK